MANKIEFEFEVKDREFKKSINSAVKGTAKVEKGFLRVNSAIGSFAGNLAANLTTGIITTAATAFRTLGSAVIDQTIKFETLTTQFTTLTGSADKAKSVLSDLSNFAATTPFQIDGIAESAKQLLSINVPAEELTGVLGRLGDIAAVTGASLTDLTIPYARLRSQNRITLEEIQKFQDRGVNLLGEFAERTGLSIADVRKSISAGTLDFQILEDTLDDLTAKGGIYANGMIKQSQTLAGITSTLSDNFDALARDIGNELLPAVKEIGLETIATLKNTRALFNAFVSEADPAKARITELQLELAKLSKQAKGLENFNFGQQGATEKLEELRARMREIVDEITNLQNASQDDEVEKAIEKEKEKQEAKRSYLLQAAEEEKILKQEIAAEIRELEKQGMLVANQEDKEALQQVIKDRLAAKKKASQEEIALRLKTKEEERKLEEKFGKAFVKINNAINSELFQGASSLAAQNINLARSENKTISGIGKVAAITQIGTDAAKGAMAAFANAVATFPPPVGPALGAVLAGAQIAFGAEQIARVRGAADGALVEGMGGGDVNPFMLSKGELVVPRKNFEDVVTDAANRRLQEQGESSQTRTAQEIVIGFADDAFEIIEQKLLERRAIGVGNL